MVVSRKLIAFIPLALGAIALPAGAETPPTPTDPPAPSEPPPGAAAPSPPPPPPPPPAAAQGVEVRGAPGSGITIDAGDAFSLNVKARFQLRYQLLASAKDAAGDRNYDQVVNVFTTRLWLSGHVLKRELTYMIQLALAGRDYRDNATSPIFDAYIDWKAHKNLSIRAGQFFVPFDRLRTVREFALQLPERPRPVGEFTLDRDTGVVLYSDKFLGSPVAWKIGAFGGGGTNLTTSKEPGGLLLARLEVRPLGPIDDDSEGDLERRAKPGLAIGAGVAGNWNTDRLRSTTGATFTGGTTDYYHAAVDLMFKWHGFAFEAEYLWKKASDDQILSVDETGAPVTEFTRSGHGWVVQGSYVLDPPIEVVARASRLYASSGTDPAFVTEVERKGQELAAGLNYYINGHRFKFQSAWIARLPDDFTIGDAEHLVVAALDATF